MKKIRSYIAVSVLAASMLAGCASSEKENSVATPTETAAPTETIAPTETVAPTETLTPTETVVPVETVTPAPETIVKLGQYKGLTLYEVESSVVAEELYNVLSEYAYLETVERAAVEGDTVNINYVGKKDGVAFEGGTDDSEEGTNLTLGSGQFIDGFEAGLIGAVAGEVRDLNLTFPENYGNTELAGQAVVFTVTVNAVQEEVVPEPSDTFAATNLGFNTWSEYVLALYAVMNESSFYEQITEQIMESSQVENYPMEEINAQKQSVYDYYYQYAQSYGSYFGVDVETALAYFLGFESLEALDAYAEDYAYQLTKNTLILEEIYKVEGLEITEEDYQARVKQYAAQYGYDDVDAFLEAYNQENIRKTIVLDYVMEYIVTQSEIVRAVNNDNIQLVE